MNTYEVFATTSDDSHLAEIEQGLACNCMIIRNKLFNLCIQDALKLWAFCIEKYPMALITIAPNKS